VGALLLSPIPATAQDDAATDPSASAVEVDPSTSAEPRASSGADAVPSVEPGVSASPAVSGVPAAVESQEPAVVVDSPTSSQGVVDAAVLGRVSVMGLAAIGGKPLVGARVRSVRKLNGKRLRFAGKPARTDANGGFVTELRGNKLPKKFEVTIGGGRYHGKRYRGVVKAFGARKDMGQYVNEATTLAVYLQRLSGVSVKRSLRWTADYLCMPDPGKQMFGLGQYGDTKFSDYSPKKLIRAAKRHGGTKKYLRAQARDRVNGTDHHCYKPKKYPRAKAFGERSARAASGQEVQASEPITIAIILKKVVLDAAIQMAKNVAKGIACSKNKKGERLAGDLISSLLSCETEGDRLKKLNDQLEKISSELSTIQSRLAKIETRLAGLIASDAYKESRLGKLRQHLTTWQMNMQLLSSQSVQVNPEKTLSPLASNEELCTAAYSGNERFAAPSGQTPASVCVSQGNLSDQFAADWGPRMATAMTGVETDVVGRKFLLIPTMQKVVTTSKKAVAGRELRGMNEALSAFVQWQTLGSLYTTAWTAFKNYWTGGPRTSCPKSPATFNKDNAPPILFNTPCAAMATTTYVLAAESYMAGNGPIEAPEEALVLTKGEQKGNVWWPYAVDLTGSQRHLNKGGGLQPEWPFFPGHGKDKYVDNVMQNIVQADKPGHSGTTPIKILKDNDTAFRLGTKQDYLDLIGFLNGVSPHESDPGGGFNSRLWSIGFQGPNMGRGNSSGQQMYYANLGTGFRKVTFGTKTIYPGTPSVTFHDLGMYSEGGRCDKVSRKFDWPKVPGLYECTVFSSSLFGYGNKAHVRGVWASEYFDMDQKNAPSNTGACPSVRESWGWNPDNLGGNNPPPGGKVCAGPDYIYRLFGNNSTRQNGTYGLMVNDQGALWRSETYLGWQNKEIPAELVQ
jgi:hypothetical protein